MVRHEKTTKSVTLSFVHDTPGPVFVAGTFNGWDTQSTPMKRKGDGRWETRLHLPPGEYQFRYYANGRWFTDYAAAGVVPNGLGEFNSILTVPDAESSTTTSMSKARALV